MSRPVDSVEAATLSGPERISLQAADGELTFIDLLTILARHKLLLIGLPLLVAVITAGISFILPNIYTATAKLLPPQQSQSTASAMLSQLGGVAALVGSSAGLKNPNDLYMGMLRSRTIADNLIQRFDLNTRYRQKFQSSTRSALATRTSISSGKDSIITIDVDDEDPKFAAQLANGYVEELLKLTQVLAVTEASQRRLFFEQQFARAKENLVKAESVARTALQQGGLVKVDDQGRALIETGARLRAQMSLKEVQIGAMRTFAAEHNPELRRAEQELDAMRRELAKLEGAGGANPGERGATAKGLDNVRLLRDLKYNEILYELLAKQYEAARIDEAKDAAIIQVLDSAVEPELKSKPKRSVIVLLASVAALLVAVFWIFFREIFMRLSSDPAEAARLQQLKRAMRVWR